MGENLEMADRKAVRAPMQWADRPGGGFTTAEESRLPRRLIREGPFGYREVNVEAQQADQESLMNWMERVIRTRKEWPAIGWGSWDVLGTRSPSVLAHVVTWHGSSVLAVHNFADAARRATIRVPAEAASGRWRRIFGRADGDEPEVRDGRLSVELPPYGYLWLGRSEGE